MRCCFCRWIDPREGNCKKVKGLPYGWEVAHSKAIGPYMIDHTTWKTYLPEQVPELWLGYLNAKTGRSGTMSPRNKAKKIGSSGVRSSTPKRRSAVRRRAPESSGLQQQQTMSVGMGDNNMMVGKLMKQMEVLHSELVSARVEQPTESTDDQRTVSTALRVANEELKALAEARTKAEAEASEENMKLVVRKTRVHTRSAVAGKENMEKSPKKQKVSSGQGLQAAIGRTRALRNKVRDNCQALGVQVT